MKKIQNALGSKPFFLGIILSFIFFYVASIVIKVNHIYFPFNQELFICGIITSILLVMIIIHRTFYSLVK
jgi:hypothetical protein